NEKAGARAKSRAPACLILAAQSAPTGSALLRLRLQPAIIGIRVGIRVLATWLAGLRDRGQPAARRGRERAGIIGTVDRLAGDHLVDLVAGQCLVFQQAARQAFPFLAMLGQDSLGGLI